VHSDLFEAVCQRDVDLLIEARHQFQHNGDFLAFLRGTGEVLHQHRIRAGAVDGHLDGQNLGIVRCRAQQLDHWIKALERMMQQDVLLANRRKNIALFFYTLGHARQVGWVTEVRTRTASV